MRNKVKRRTRQIFGSLLIVALMSQCFGFGKLTGTANAAAISWEDVNASGISSFAEFYKIAYGNGMWLGAGNNGFLAYSNDGRNWSDTENKTPDKTKSILKDALMGLTYSKDHWLGVSLQDSIEKSGGNPLDEWTVFKPVSRITDFLTDVTHGKDANGNDLTVAAGFNGVIVTSRDDTTWSASSSKLDDSFLTSVANGGGRFVVAGYKLDETYTNYVKGLIYTSTDGQSFNAGTIGGYINGLTYGQGKFVAVGVDGNNNGYIGVSTDGVNFITKSLPANSKELTSVAFGGGKFVAAGYGGMILTSSDGEIWTRETTNTTTTDYKTVAYGQDRFVVSDLQGHMKTAIVTEIKDSTISPISANFDKKTSAQTNVTTELTLNGNTLTSIKNGSATLVQGTDYTIFGTTVTINKTYLAQQPVGTTTLTFMFSAGVSQSFTVNVSDSTPKDSLINPQNAVFDKNIAFQADVSTTVTPNGNTISNIFNGGYKLVLGMDYTVSGATVKILKSYLAQQAEGTTTLTFKFSAGNDQTLTITVTDTTPKNSGITPTTADFDKNVANQANVAVTLDLKGNTLSSISNNGTALSYGTDYTLSGSTLRILKQYLAQQAEGTTTLTFKFSAGNDQTLTITVYATTPKNSLITPTTADFDKNVANQANVAMTLDLKGNMLSSISNNGTALSYGIDYTLSGSTLRILKQYMAQQAEGTTTLTFKFSAGNDQTLTITVTDTTPKNSGITPTTANFDKNVANQVDVDVTLDLKGNTLSSIQNGGSALVEGADYTVSGNTVTILKSYLAKESEGTTMLTFKFSAGNDQTLTITVADTTPKNSLITPTTADFDKNVANQANVAVTLDLKGNTLSSISNNGTALSYGTDYTLSGSTLRILKQYLAQQAEGTTTLTFKFSAGNDQTLTITVTDTTPKNSGITPMRASFDKNVANQADVNVTLDLKGNTLSSISNSGTALVEGTDYTVSGNSVTILKAYLAKESEGTTTLTFKFSAGNDQTLTITVTDTTPKNSGITPTRASFDKNVANQADVNVTLDLKGNTLSSISNSGTALVEGTDYTVSGNSVTILKAYLAKESEGTTTLTFKFSAGNDQTLTITVTDSTSGSVPQDSMISPNTGTFDKKVSVSEDVYTYLTLNGNALLNITNASTALLDGTDYTLDGNKIAVKKDYLLQQQLGTLVLTFHFSAGADQILTIAISDSTSGQTPQDSTISPSAGTFDKNATAQTDLMTTLTLNGNHLVQILNGSYELQEGTDYTITGDQVTISKSYLAKLSVGTSTLMFVFDAGNSQSYTVKVQDSTTPTVPETPSNPSPGPAPSVPSTPAPELKVKILVNGKEKSFGILKVDHNKTTVIVDQKSLEDALSELGESAVVTILVPKATDIVIGELNGQLIQLLQNKKATLSLKTGNAFFTIPASLIGLNQIADYFGKGTVLADMKFQVEIQKVSPESQALLNKAAENQKITLFDPAFQFNVRALYGTQQMDIPRFSFYTQRAIAMPESIDPKRITTGVFLGKNGNIHHVPTKVVMIDRQYYALISSMYNGTYSVVWNPVEFKDAAGHWGKKDINDMGSRLVIEGTTAGIFEPDRQITRAEFAAILVRGLGLQNEAEGSTFSDVNSSSWYASAIRTAMENKLINGYEDGSFRPDAMVTREQAMHMIANAMSMTGLLSKLSDTQQEAPLAKFKDASDVAGWAAADIAACLQANIVNGKDGSRLAPKEEITRAEVAAIIQRLLSQSDLI
ncbi:X2-like carbohydrate binding domain-containing protein [Paenibacillus dendrobii]|nr:X2-like carbohydrate binding domain-containing protein [Paenibacillus dendrobii]